jgi:hypothetical protein
MKKAQISDYLVIFILVFVIILFVFFNKLRNIETTFSKTKETSSDFKNDFVSSSVSKFRYLTIKGVSLNELMGVFVCYNKDIVDYGNGPINISYEIRNRLDQIYGLNNWKIELNNSICISSKEKRNETCEIPSDKEYIIYEFLFPLSCYVENSKGKIIISEVN